MKRRTEQIAAFGLAMGPQGLFGVPTLGDPWFVDPNNGVASRRQQAHDPTKPALYLNDVLDVAASGDDIYLAPGDYDEVVVTDRTQHKYIRLIGLGGRGSVALVPSGTNDTALDQRADDVTLFNVGCAGKGTGQGLKNYGARLRALCSKFENDDGTGLGLTLQVATIAQKAALTHGTCGDVLIDDCEIAWAATGLKLVGSDYGAVTQARIRRSRFYALSAAALEEGNNGGSASEQYRNLLIEECSFEPAEDGTEPTKYISLNDNNANTGQAKRNTFGVTLASGKNLVSTKLLWVGNYHPAGLSTGQPS